MTTTPTRDLTGQGHEQASRPVDLYRRMDALRAGPRPKTHALPLPQVLRVADELEHLAELELSKENVADSEPDRKVRALTSHITDTHRAAWWVELLACLDLRGQQDDGLREPPGDYEPDWSARVDEALAELIGDDRIRTRSAC